MPSDLLQIDDVELDRHRAEGDCWVAFEDRVYDASHFHHPGGLAMLTDPDDRDITRAFRAAHGPHAEHVLRGLPLVGRYAPRANALGPAIFDADASTLSTLFDCEGRAEPGPTRTLASSPVAPKTAALHEAFRAFVFGDDFPCLGARIALSRGTYAFAEYPGPIGSEKNGPPLARDLTCWAAYQPLLWARGQHFTTFVAIFPAGDPLPSEVEFEDRLMKQLQSLHDFDRAPWPAEVTADPTNEKFSLVFAGRTYFPVGLFPKSSRKGRAFEHPAVVFNAQAQFGHLIDTGQFKPLSAAIRRHDRRITGSVNPNIEPGQAGSSLGEASGRDHSQDATPFRPPLQIWREPESRPGWPGPVTGAERAWSSRASSHPRPSDAAR